MADTKISALTAASTPLAGTEVLPIVQLGSTVKVSAADITAGRTIGMAGANITGLTASSAVATDASKNLVSVANTGTGSNVLATSPTIATPTITGPTTINANGSALAVNIVGRAAGQEEAWLYFYKNNGTTLNAGILGTNQGLTLAYGSSATFGVTLGTTGNVTVNTGNLVQGTAAKGINFTANTPASGMTSQLLNWYEEGTWTPNQGSGLTVTGSFSSAGTYTRVGRMVFVSGEVSGSTSVAIPATDLICTNLPFTTAVKSLGALNTGTLAQAGQVILYSGTSLYGTTTAAASTIYFTIVYSV